MTHPSGDADILINGQAHKLRLTLGALADIEGALGGDFEALQARLQRPRIGDVLIILHALLAGGGSTLSLAGLKASEIDIGEAARAIAEAFKALGAAAPNIAASDAAAPNIVEAGENAAPGKSRPGTPVSGTPAPERRTAETATSATQSTRNGRA